MSLITLLQCVTSTSRLYEYLYRRIALTDAGLTDLENLFKVKAPWTMQCFLVDDDDDCNYIIPK
jgi:hypothetical protein